MLYRKMVIQEAAKDIQIIVENQNKKWYTKTNSKKYCRKDVSLQKALWEFQYPINIKGKGE